MQQPVVPSDLAAALLPVASPGGGGPTLDLLSFLVGFGVLLAAGRLAGEAAHRLGQPEVLGQLIAGVLLGPSLVGQLDAWDGVLDGSSGLALNGVAEIGALLLLFVAGLEVDLRTMRDQARPGAYVAASAILPSLLAGPLVAAWLFDSSFEEGAYLGVVLSVTALSVVGQLFISRGSTGRRYAQLVLAGGVAAEVLVWLLVAVVSALESGDAFSRGALSLLAAVAFFAFAVVVGRPLVQRTMRLSADQLGVPFGQLSLVLGLLLLFAATTEALGLHSLLGAFVLGVLLRRAPRVTKHLNERVETLTVGVFAPVFFVLAGTRVDLTTLDREGFQATALLFVVATAVKVLPTMLGAMAGRLPALEGLAVGVALATKGGTDVVVAILGFQLELLSQEVFTAYTVVALATVVVVPPALAVLERAAPVSAEEQEKLTAAEAESVSYVPQLERVLVPIREDLKPSLAVDVVEHLALTQSDRGKGFDITELSVDVASRTRPDDSISGRDVVTRASGVAVARRTVEKDQDFVDAVLRASEGHDLIAVGAPLGVEGGGFGPLVDEIVERSTVDVLVVCSDARHLPWSRIKRVMVPTNGLDHSMHAADVAGYLAEGTDAELVAISVQREELRQGSTGVRGLARLSELRFRLTRLNVRLTTKVRYANEVGPALLEELRRERDAPFGLVVMGGLDRTGDGSAWLGPTIDTVLQRADVPTVVLVQHTARQREDADDL